MEISTRTDLIMRRYREVHGAKVVGTFDQFLESSAGCVQNAVLGYRRADQGPLFLERYLDLTVEEAVSRAFDQPVERADIVELGNFAAANGIAMINLWALAANDLGSAAQVAVATLTTPLRAIFARIGVPLVALAPARREALGSAAADWGDYYDKNPQVCVGRIAEGQAAIRRHFALRHARSAA